MLVGGDWTWWGVGGQIQSRYLERNFGEVGPSRNNESTRAVRLIYFGKEINMGSAELGNYKVRGCEGRSLDQ